MKEGGGGVTAEERGRASYEEHEGRTFEEARVYMLFCFRLSPKRRAAVRATDARNSPVSIDGSLSKNGGLALLSHPDPVHAVLPAEWSIRRHSPE